MLVLTSIASLSNFHLNLRIFSLKNNMRQHRFFIGQDLGSRIKVAGDSADPVVFEFNPEQVNFSDELSNKYLSKSAIIAHQREIISQWKKVFRYQAGDFVILFDGKIEVKAKIIELSKQNDIARFVLEGGMRDKALSVKNKSQIWLGSSILKGEHTDMVVEKATELGVSGIILIQTDRVIKKGANLERLQKIAIESSEQCGRIDVPVVTTCEDLKLLLNKNSEMSDEFKFDKKIVFNMGGKNINEVISENGGEKNRNTLVCVGPEGGWSETEGEYFKQLADDGEISIASLGGNVLRAETAAIVGLGAFYLR